MTKRQSPAQAEIEFTDFAHAPPSERDDDFSGALPPESQAKHILDAIADGLQPVRAGEFADEKAIDAILRRAGA